ncbi:MAG: hypothetical protein IM658_05995 [Phenylobacterium sp.]|jgi:ElaB/YqjD/DUF883 family membrane-anchored ribosome-binding protein|uniref:DUF883 family protein n=1 Tax=Phenylobacterium sp. TaxID=1871053 RepID=UPI0025DDC927|nr:hypothetical protein [Phenylobacterium sp.]MCA3710242.1 hypothetical protein [Phenylobacterium sp.]MCA3713742.1 hypothetical protein [Phenylobacterium sp.]MCA3715582.1 hypothetical protein [Phenylobacterium sp.]MCA3724023.1 hypothetical protein [Phenylobacterium sp.]MCA3727238.1 hypothetical protein [Phenylobacterium sp.]
MTATPADKAVRAARSAAKSTVDIAEDAVEQAERKLADAAHRIEKAIAEGVDQIRAHGKAYAAEAVDQIEDAQRYVVGQVRERPLAATGLALGVGVLIGLILSSGRHR